jgi:SAM-dependent methyltransferase
MSHAEQQDFCARVRALLPRYFGPGQRVLDVGSLDINGSNRYLFDSPDYVGLDVGPGRNVDVVCPVHEYDGAFDVVVSTECFEHDRHYEKSLQRIVMLLKPGGLFFFSCATTGRAEHGTRASNPGDSPLTASIDGWSDYYKNLTEDDVRRAISVESFFSAFAFEVNAAHADLYFWGIRR